MALGRPEARSGGRGSLLERVRAGLILVAAVALLVAAGGLLIALANSQKATDAFVGATFERIGAADRLSLALDAFVRLAARDDPRAAAARQDLAARSARLQALTRADPAAAARADAIVRLIGQGATALVQRRDLAILDQARARIVDFRQQERRQITLYRAGFETRQRTSLLAALAAVVLGFGAGGLATAVFAGRRRRAEASLAETAQILNDVAAEAVRAANLLNGIGAATPDMIFAKDRECRFTYANPTVLRSLGRSWDEIAGRRSEDLVDYPPGTELPSIADRRVMESGQVETIETSLTAPDGVHRHYRTTKFPLRDPGGAIVGMAGLTVDVTELTTSRQALAASESRYRAIANAMPAIVWTADGQGRRDFFNDRWREFTGADDASSHGWGWLDHVHPEDRDRVRGDIERELAADEPHEIQYRLVGATGSRWMLERAVPVRDEISGERRWKGACIDIQELVESRHEREAAEQRVLDAQAELAHVSRLSAMGEMASALAHELNQPLSATANYVQGSLRLLNQTPLDMPLIKEALGVAGEQMFRAGDIIRRLREFVAKGETEHRLENLPQLLEEAGALAMVGAKDRGVRLHYEMSPEVGMVLVDRVQIQQVVLNLMRNAVEAMADAPRRELAVATCWTAEDVIRVSVRDTGTGIQPEIAAQLFSPFVTTKQQGMGVGLSISRTIVESHGGRIWAEPNPGGGTVFSFTLPAVSRMELEDSGLV